MLASIIRSERHRPGLRLAVWIGAAAVMVLPVLAMRAFDGSASDPGDFIFLAILVTGVGGAYELAARVPGRNAYRAGVAIALAAASGSTLQSALSATRMTGPI